MERRTTFDPADIARSYRLSFRCSVWFYWNEAKRGRRRTRQDHRYRFTGDELPGCGSEQAMHREYGGSSVE